MEPVRLDYSIPDDLPDSLPVIPLVRGVLFPGAVMPLTLGRKKSLAAARAAKDGLVLIGFQREPVDQPMASDLIPILTLARVVRSQKGRGGAQLIVTQGLARVRPTAFTRTAPYLQAAFEVVAETWPRTVEGEAVEGLLREVIGDVHDLLGDEEQLGQLIDKLPSPQLLVDAAAGALEESAEWKREILQVLDPQVRAERVIQRLQHARDVFATRKSIRDKMASDADHQTREIMLRRQLKAIQEELDEGATGDDLQQLGERLDKLPLPEEVRDVVDRELARMERLGQQSHERSVAVDWLEWIGDMPWGVETSVDVDIDKLEHALDDSHHGLDDVKRQVVEHLAVRKLAGSGRADVLLLVGPPGVGKTSIGQAIADATGRKLVRVALGGMRDEAELRGHRRTYVGARPGRLVEGFRRAGTADPVVLLDEVDKMGRGWQGDPAAALLEILDPEQNHAFTDHYLEVPFDLSKALFIATANDVSSISGPLRDRMEEIDIAGYTADEKVVIARRHLLSKLAANAGLAPEDVDVSDEVLRAVVTGWTREAGVRQLQRRLGRLYRAAAVRKARGTLEGPFVVAVDELVTHLGRQRFTPEVHDGQTRAGIATGLAWTPVGGDVLYVEASRLPGAGKLVLTGQLGDIMKESAQAALTYVLSESDRLGIDARRLEKENVHVHVPAGAVPKDGPSAGVTIFTALASLLSDRPVRPDVAMTGEATLGGRVLPVGGIKSKVLAAHRRGIKRVILPKRNAPDVEDVPKEARDALEFVFVERMEDVLEAALAPPPATGQRLADAA